MFEPRIRMSRALVLVGLLAACGTARLQPDPAPVRAPASLLGSFVDDYGIQYRISDSLWHQLPGSRYHIVEWHADQQFLIARNDAANPSDGDLWTRIDWVELEDMPPWSWAFCLGTYDATSREAAHEVAVADRSSPRTGCNEHPFSRMRSVEQ